ncbi:hypothetical protein IAQ61_005157 [Plenodomus lingam]|uniref:uncharacterized protein n=1 Tax=Leptosphaeria maculans TaxID=5022 RepID=UPI0033185AFE|nr:hypothetical protein IAQ61_005157 [Plenodomus lingam]
MWSVLVRGISQHIHGVATAISGYTGQAVAYQPWPPPPLTRLCTVASYVTRVLVHVAWSKEHLWQAASERTDMLKRYLLGDLQQAPVRTWANAGSSTMSIQRTADVRCNTLTLFIPRIDPKRVIWNGRGSNPVEALARYDIHAAYFIDQLPTYLKTWADHPRNQGAKIYALHPSQIPSSPVRVSCMDTTALMPAMDMCRMIKDDHEIQLIRKANDISSQAHRGVLANILKFKNEAQVEGLFVDMCISMQAKEQAYDPIAASGPNAGTLHYDANNEDFEDRQLMCLDAGCEYELYASDITRTFPLAPSWPTQEAENIYKLVERMQEACIERLAPGVRYLDLHIRAHQIAIDGLLQLGIFHNGTREEIYKAGTSRAFFPHGLGHHIGLEVHDVGQADLMSVRRGKIVTQQVRACTCHAPTDPQSSQLEAGMVVTVEPGIYFSDYALKQFYLPLPEHAKFINVEVLERYMPVGGVRIEDDILITSRGYENLTTAPKGEAMFDIIRGKITDYNGDQRRVCSPRRRSTENAKPLLRAPGLKSTIATPVLRPLARAETMPTSFGQHDTIDFEPHAGPSLFSNFKRSMTTDDRVREWQRHRDEPRHSVTVVSGPVTVCGQATPNVQHTYMTNASDLAELSSPVPLPTDGEKCKDCALLVQTLDRLRRNLQSPKATPPKQVAEDSWARHCRSEKEATQQRLAQRAKEEHSPLDFRGSSLLSKNEFVAEPTHMAQPTTLFRTSPYSHKSAPNISKEPPAAPSPRAFTSTPPTKTQYPPSHSSSPPLPSDIKHLETYMRDLHLTHPIPAPAPQTINPLRAPHTSAFLPPKDQHEQSAVHLGLSVSPQDRERAWFEHKRIDRDRSNRDPAGWGIHTDDLKRWNGL